MAEGNENATPLTLHSSQSVQSLSRVRLFMTPWTAALQASLSITNSWSLLKLMSIESVMPSSHLILCGRLLLPPSIFPNIRVSSNESVLCIRRPKYWSFSFSMSPSNEYSGLISFRIHWFDLLAVQVTLRSVLQHHSSKASILQHSVFFTVQYSHPYMPTGKTFLPRRQHVLISWLESLSAVIWEPIKIKFVTVCIVSPSICHEVMGLDDMIIIF